MGLMAVTIRRRISPETLELSGRNHADCHINIPNSRAVSGARRGRGAALFFGTTHMRREPPVEARDVARVATVGAAVPHRLPDTGDGFVPVFDIARIEPAGDAVIAGRAGPGAIVELLRNGKLHDRAVADHFGQFVMVPSRLPPGEYELTLRSREPDGKEATSKRSVVVALQPSLNDQTVVAPMKLDKASAVQCSPCRRQKRKGVRETKAGRASTVGAR